MDKMMLFGIPMEKDPQGSQAYCSHGVVQEAMKALEGPVPGAVSHRRCVYV